MKPRYYYDTCFRQNYYFFIGWDHQKFLDYMTKNYRVSFEKPGIFDGKTGLITNDQNSIIIIWTKYKPTTPKGMGILAHECLHAVGYTFDIVGVDYSQKNDEPFCYLLGRLVEEGAKSGKNK